MACFKQYGRGVLVAAALLVLGGLALWRGGELVRYYRASAAAGVPEVEAAIRHALVAAASPEAETLDAHAFLAQLRRELPPGAAGRFEVHRFDPDAPVFITTGPDDQPGQAGFDDDQDGTVDNPSELGAVFSDDATLAPTDPGYTAAEAAPETRVISRGAYVPVEPVTPLPAAERLRVVLHGTADRRPFAWPVEPPP